MKGKRDKLSIKKRQRDLRNFILDYNDKLITKKQIDAFYKLNYPSFSQSTILRDLSDINAKCDKKNGNRYYLKDIRHIHSIKNKICNLLKKCTIYKPLELSKSIDILNDNNPVLNYYCITIKCNSQNHDEYYIENLISNLKKLPDFYDSYDKFNYIEIKQSVSSIMFIFDDIDSMKNFYIFINDLRSFND